MVSWFPKIYSKEQPEIHEIHKMSQWCVAPEPV